MKTDLAQYSHRRCNTGPYADDLDVDVIIVGGGFGECIINLRSAAADVSSQVASSASRRSASMDFEL